MRFRASQTRHGVTKVVGLGGERFSSTKIQSSVVSTVVGQGEGEGGMDWTRKGPWAQTWSCVNAGVRGVVCRSVERFVGEREIGMVDGGRQWVLLWGWGNGGAERETRGELGGEGAGYKSKLRRKEHIGTSALGYFATAAIGLRHDRKTRSFFFS